MNNFAPIRRQDRLLSQERTYDLLENAEYGFLSVGIDNNGYAYGVPLNFVYDKENSSIYFHCAPQGHKNSILKNNSKVSFCIVGNTKPLPDKFVTEYESVIVFGKAHIQLSDDEKRVAVRKLVQKYSPDYIQQGEKYMEKSFSRVMAIKITIEHITGKSKPTAV